MSKAKAKTKAARKAPEASASESRSSTQSPARKTMPQKTIDAILAAEHRIKPGITVRRITVGLSAVLDQIGSPLVSAKIPDADIEKVEGLFAMTRPAVESQELLVQGRDVFRAAAVAWADGIELDELAPIVAACLAQICRQAGVMPPSGGLEKNAR